jgi:hypothetical protein
MSHNPHILKTLHASLLHAIPSSRYSSLKFRKQKTYMQGLNTGQGGGSLSQWHPSSRMMKSPEETAMRLRLIALCVLLAMELPAGWAQPTPAEYDPHYSYAYCVLIDNVRSTLYFSNSFPVKALPKATYVDAFHEYLHKNYPRIYGTPECNYTDSIFSSQRSKENMESHFRGAYRSLIETNWIY